MKVNVKVLQFKCEYSIEFWYLFWWSLGRLLFLLELSWLPTSLEKGTCWPRRNNFQHIQHWRTCRGTTCRLYDSDGWKKWGAGRIHTLDNHIQLFLHISDLEFTCLGLQNIHFLWCCMLITQESASNTSGMGKKGKQHSPNHVTYQLPYRLSSSPISIGNHTCWNMLDRSVARTSC